MPTTARTARKVTFDMHPLSADLSSLNDEELLKKINELHKRLRTAYMFPDPSISMQLRMLLDDHQNEYNARMRKEAEKFAQQNKKFSEKIDIE